MSEKHKVAVVQLTLDNEFIATHASATDAGKTTGIKRQYIFKCCRDNTLSNGGFKWRYLDLERSKVQYKRKDV